jgi:glutathione S-transferase
MWKSKVFERDQMLRVLGKPTSINVRKVLWTCAVLDIPVTPEPWGSGHQSCGEPEFMALNPNAMVPVLVEDGVPLWESNTICRYLAARHQRSDLLPASPMARAQVEKWMDWQIAELNNAWRYAFMGLVRESPLHLDRAAIDTSAAAWNRHMAILERQLAITGAYVAGQDFTLADIVLGLSTHRWLSTPMARPTLPAVAAWYQRLGQHAGFAEHCDNGVP